MVIGSNRIELLELPGFKNIYVMSYHLFSYNLTQC